MPGDGGPSSADGHADSARSQFEVATHAPILMAYPGADVWQFGADSIEKVAAQDTEHWRILRGFLGDPERVLRELLRGP